MSREAIESFIDEIRDELPRMRRAFAIIHACPSDDDALLEAHRLTHSIKGTAALVGIGTLSEIARQQETLIERLMSGQLCMDDELRDTLERIADIIESYADSLSSGNIPSERLLEKTIQLCSRHPSRPIAAKLPALVNVVPVALEKADLPDTFVSSDDGDDLMTLEGECHGISPFATPEIECPEEAAASHVPAHEVDIEGQVAEDFRSEAMSHLHMMMERLDTYRGDLTRWDVLADVRRRVHSLKHAADETGLHDFSRLAQHAERLLQQLLDRTVLPTEHAADCLQACVDALESRLDCNLDQSLLEELQDRIDELCESGCPRDDQESRRDSFGSEKFENTSLNSNTVDESNGRDSLPTSAAEMTVNLIHTGVCEPIEFDDRSEISEEMLDVFTEEAEEHLRLMYAAFAELEKNPARRDVLQEVRRSAHTIKGAAGSVGLRLISKLSHRTEDLLDRLLSSQEPISVSAVALLYDTTDALQDLVHGDFATDGMRATVGQLYDSYDILLATQESKSNQQPVGSADAIEQANGRFYSHTRCSEIVEPIVTPITVDVPAANELSPVVAGEPAINDSAPNDVELDSSNDTVSLVVSEKATLEFAEDSSDDEAVCSDAPGAGGAVDTPLSTQNDRSGSQVFESILAPWNQHAASMQTLAGQAMRNGHERPRSESLRVSLAKIDSLMHDVGELIINRSTFEPRMKDFSHCLEELNRAAERLRNISHRLDANYAVSALGGRWRGLSEGDSLLPKRTGSIGQASEEFDALEFDRYSDFHLLAQSLSETTTDIGAVRRDLGNLNREFDALLRRQGRLSRETQERLLGIRMVPLGSLSSRLQRTVRVIADQQGKRVDLVIQGGETELDKFVLEELAAPLMHLLRNAVDHGVENPEVRQKAGKLEAAKICVDAGYQGTQVVIQISDDGAGLNYDAIREKAVEQRLITASDAERLNENELSALIFVPGFSTACEISEVSGRGVGMDIVRDKVQKLNGTIAVSSKSGHGTSFTICLPMTLAVTRAMLIRVGDETFALPLQSVLKILRFDQREIDRTTTPPSVPYGDEALPLSELADELALPKSSEKKSSTLPVLILAAGDRKVAVTVDKVLPARDIVVKTLGTHLRKIRGLMGATLMGDGSVVPILDVADLFREQRSSRYPTAIAPDEVPPTNDTPTIMVVDDSVSVRRVTSNLLKGAGWKVLEAKDGLDAIEKLEDSNVPPRLFLLDIEMPRMDGYELLSWLRSQAEHRTTPIVMVTSRAGEKHREKASRLGATDYVVKPYQDSELLSLLHNFLAGRSVSTTSGNSAEEPLHPPTDELILPASTVSSLGN